MKYKGVDYQYAFEFNVPVEGGDRRFQIVISKFREDSMDFSGLCLENELRVISEKAIPFEAFFEIIDETINITVEGEKDILEMNPGHPVRPLLTVTDEGFLRRFKECKESTDSVKYYQQLRQYFEKPGSGNITPDLQNQLDVMFFLFHFQWWNGPEIRNLRAFVI